MKTCNIGDLVKMSKYARRSLDEVPTGFGCVVRISGRDIAYITWYESGKTKPYNIRWLEIFDESE